MPHIHVHVSIHLAVIGSAVVLISTGFAVWYNKWKKQAKQATSPFLPPTNHTTDDDTPEALHSCDYVGCLS